MRSATAWANSPYAWVHHVCCARNARSAAQTHCRSLQTRERAVMSAWRCRATWGRHSGSTLSGTRNCWRRSRTSSRLRARGAWLGQPLAAAVHKRLSPYVSSVSALSSCLTHLWGARPWSGTPHADRTHAARAAEHTGCHGCFRHGGGPLTLARLIRPRFAGALTAAQALRPGAHIPRFSALRCSPRIDITACTAATCAMRLAASPFMLCPQRHTCGMHPSARISCKYELRDRRMASAP